jgi:hypothetical protein
LSRYYSSISLTADEKSATKNGLVITAMPDGRWPLPTATFYAAIPIMQSAFEFVVTPRAEMQLPPPRITAHRHQAL